MSDNTNNPQSLEEYIIHLKSDDAEFAEYMDDENIQTDCISFDNWLLRKRKKQAAAAEVTHPEAAPIVIPQPSHEVLASGTRAKSIKKYLDDATYNKKAATKAITHIGHLINDLTPIKRQWKDAISAPDLGAVFKTFHKWGFKDYKAFSTAYDDLLEMKEKLTNHVDKSVVENIKVGVKRERDEVDQEGKDEPVVHSAAARGGFGRK